MAAWNLPCEVASWIVQMSFVLDRRIAWRLLPLLVGALFGQVRQTDLKSIAPWYKVKFQTKLQQAVALVEWIVQTLAGLGKTLWIVADGAYAKRPFLRGALALGAVVVSRLRKDAALWSVPETI